MKNLLSVVINCRNDNYHDNFIDRLSNAINLNLYFLDKIGHKEKIKFVISDWGSEEPISNKINIYKDFTENVDFVNVKKKDADELSQMQPGGFYPELSANVGIRKSNSEYILYTGADQIFPKSGWLNLINLLEGKNKLETNIFDTVFYIPRKFIDINFYRQDPSFYMFERYIDFMNFSAIPFKTPAFYVGGGYSTLCSKKIFEELRGFSENDIPGCATDVDFHSRIKKLGLNQIDVSQLGVHMFKFPSEADSVRQILLYKTNLTRRIPDLKKDIVLNDISWGLDKYNIEVKKSENKSLSLYKEKKELFRKKYKKTLSFKEKLKILFFFENYRLSLKELKFLFFISCLLKSIRAFSLIECGFDNINRILSIGKEFKYLEFLTFDQKSLLKENNYRNRLYKAQVLLSNNRHAKFTALNSDSYDEFIKTLNHIPNEKFSSLFLINFNEVKNDIENLNKLNQYILNNSKLFSIIIVTTPSQDCEEKFKILKNNFQIVLKNNDLLLFINKKTLDVKIESKKIIEIHSLNSNTNYFKLIIGFASISFYKRLSLWLKKIHFSIFKFRFK